MTEANLPLSPKQLGSISYYNTNAKEYFDETIGLNLQHLYSYFLPLIPMGGHILDAGSGSGRDTIAFRNLGYQVTAIDASEEMVKLAAEFTGNKFLHMTFQEMDFSNMYDGIWACASLIHVPLEELPDIFSRFRRALKPLGIWYLSFKLGEGERYDQGRLFLDFNETTFREFASQWFDGEIVRIWVTDPIKPCSDDRWLNALLQNPQVK